MSPKATKWDGRVPFHPKTGSLMHYPERIWTDAGSSEPVWRPNYTFEARLQYGGFVRGRSAAYVVFVDKQRVVYPMFLSDLDLLLSTQVIDCGHVTGKWTFAKKGANYGLRMIKS